MYSLRKVKVTYARCPLRVLIANRESQETLVRSLNRLARDPLEANRDWNTGPITYGYFEKAPGQIGKEGPLSESDAVFIHSVILIDPNSIEVDQDPGTPIGEVRFSATISRGGRGAMEEPGREPVPGVTTIKTKEGDRYVYTNSVNGQVYIKELTPQQFEDAKQFHIGQSDLAHEINWHFPAACGQMVARSMGAPLHTVMLRKFIDANFADGSQGFHLSATYWSRLDQPDMAMIVI